MRRLGVLVGLVLLIAAGQCSIGGAQARPPAQELLAVSGDLTYDVRPDDGPVSVTWQVTVTNNDPTTTFQQSGFVQFYEGIALPVLRGASALTATGPGGVVLGTSLEQPDEPVLAVANVFFDRNLFFGETYSLTLTYELEQVQSDFLLVSEYYAFLPAISLGDSSVSVVTPDGGGWDVSVQDVGDCAPAAPGEFDCSGTYEMTQVAALVEVSRPGALEASERDVALEEQTVAVTIRHFPGQDAWADHAAALASAALPVLEELFGFAYDGPETLEIAQSGRRSVFGYDGIFSCTALECTIGVLPLAVDQVLLHELAHMWTADFRDRWLQEGLAEFMASRAADRLAEIVIEADLVAFEQFVDVQLEGWGPPSYLLNATREQQEREISGYAGALALIEELEATVGLEALQAANAAAHERGSADSRRYFDLLEEASGQDLEQLFRDRVFLPDSITLLEERRATRDRLAALERAVEEAGLELQGRIADLTGEWRFDRANEVMAGAETALDVLTTARDDVERPRSFWQRIGLIGADPEDAIADAEAAFNRGDYDGSNSLAGDAARMIDDANRNALIRVLVVLGGGLGIVLVLGAGVLLLRRRRAPVW